MSRKPKFPSGIYVIQNRVNGHRYIGSAALLPKRKQQHFAQLEAGKHHSRYLQRAWNKYGADAFSFSVALHCDRENLIGYEQALIGFYRPEYNCAPVAGSQLGYRHTAEARKKMADSARHNRNFAGKRHTEETKRRISENRKGKGGGPMSAERRAKISAAHKGRVIPQEMRDRISATLTGTSTGRGQLTPEQVRAVRRLRERLGWGRFRIARVMGISPSAANAVIGGHAYLWVT